MGWICFIRRGRRWRIREQVERLKQGVEGWNKWRKENRGMKINLEEADLTGVFLENANLKDADFDGANLNGTNLKGANLLRSLFIYSSLIKANLIGANLGGAHLEYAKLREATLNGASLQDVNLSFADLRGATLKRADLKRTCFVETNLEKTDLKEAQLGYTILGNIDLSETKGLDEVIHSFPSPISTDTLQRSKGKIPEKFLRGCGLSDWEIESAKLYQPGLSARKQMILFIVFMI